MYLKQIAEFLKTKGYQVSANNNYLRIEYWRRMPSHHFVKFQHLIDEQEIEDEDAGRQYSYHLKEHLQNKEN